MAFGVLQCRYLSKYLDESNNGSATSDDSMLEEASLYAANGRMEKAVDILKEIVGRNPSKEDAWKLLLSTYSALGKSIEFEKTARSFLQLAMKSVPVAD